MPSPYARADAEWLIDFCADDAAAGRDGHLLAVDGAGTLVGTVGLTGLDREPAAESATGSPPGARPRGRPAGRGAAAGLGAARARRARVELRAHPANAASLRVAAKAGFTATGESRRAPDGARMIVLRRD